MPYAESGPPPRILGAGMPAAVLGVPRQPAPLRPARAETRPARRVVKAGDKASGKASDKGAALPDPHLLTAIFEGLRDQTRALTVPLSVEDQAVQSMPDASPTKWHLAHTTWFFENFILAKYRPDYERYNGQYSYLFNSYYEGVGPRQPRTARGLLTRPSSAEIGRYRAYVDDHMARFMAGFLNGANSNTTWDKIAPLILLGCHHEQQHQELLLMDALHLFSSNPTLPAYTQAAPRPPRALAPLRWINFPGGDYQIGHAPPEQGGTHFAFDNEGPRHVVKLQPFALASRAVTNGEWQAFMNAGGYTRPQLWLSDGWDAVQKNGWTAPLYWKRTQAGGWQQFTLNGLKPLDLSAPVCHISYYEADAYARWSGYRLPTEAEWETAARSTARIDLSAATLLECGALEPLAPVWSEGAQLQQMFGDVWEWTQSAYAPYPGFRATTDAIGEYNGKFMINQMVLRGGSCVTPAGHIRATYRNFFYPHMRWQFAGLRLASSV